MVAQFDRDTLSGKHAEYAQKISEIYTCFNFDFVALGLTPFIGAPLRWIYSAGETSNRFRRIALSPGHGIGGIVLKAGKPMLYTDIDNEIDPREYSSYPIVFAEDLRSFCALPLQKEGRVVGVLLMAFRTANEAHSAAYRGCLSALQDKYCDLDIISEGFLDFEMISHYEDNTQYSSPGLNRSSVSLAIAAQEQERKRISREIHDGIVQELLSVSLQLNRLSYQINSEDDKEALSEAVNNIDRVLDELHNLSVELRPSTLDHFGLKAALRSQISVYEQTYGARVEISGTDDIGRFDSACETQIYRICQEAILNACKYSNADVIHLRLDAANEWLQVVIEDHGDGFDVENPVVRGSGCGLQGMRERANILGATLQIDSNANGTRVSLLAPMYITHQEKEAE